MINKVLLILIFSIVVFSCKNERLINLDEIRLNYSGKRAQLDSTKFDRRIKEITKDFVKVNYICLAKNNERSQSLHDLWHYNSINDDNYRITSDYQNENYWQDKFLCYYVYSFLGNVDHTDSIFFFAVDKDRNNIFLLDGYCINEINKLVKQHIAPIKTAEDAYKVGRFLTSYCLNYLYPVKLIDRRNIKDYKNLKVDMGLKQIELPKMYQYGDKFKLVIYSVVNRKYTFTFKNTIVLNRDSIISYRQEHILGENQKKRNVTKLFR